jgi:hypothetical protein
MKEERRSAVVCFELTDQELEKVVGGLLPVDPPVRPVGPPTHFHPPIMLYPMGGSIPSPVNPGGPIRFL